MLLAHETISCWYSFPIHLGWNPKPRGACGLYTELINVRTVKGNMPSGELVMEAPLIVVWCGGVDGGSVRSRIGSPGAG